MRAWEANIRKVVPYVPGEQPKGQNLIKLNTNENPYPPAPGVAKALQEMDVDALRKYPDPAATALVDALAEFHGLKSNQVFVGVGSDDVLGMAFLTFFNSGKPVLFRISPTRFIRCGRSFLEYLTRRRPLTGNSGSGKRIITGRMGA